MEIRKDLTKILGGVLVGGMLLSGGMAVAGDTTDSAAGKLAGKIPFFGAGLKHGGGMGQFKGARGMLSQETLDKLVKDGVITQANADEIKAFVDKKKDENSGQRRGAGVGLMEGLVTNKILTQQQADTIQAKTREIAQAQQQQQLSDSLKAVVKKGTITQEQSDKIVKRFEAAAKEREAQLAKMENMTLKEIRQDMANNKGKSQNPMEQLVTEGVITQEQADAIQKANMETAQKQNLQRISDSLKALVNKGTISQEQSDKILKKIEETRQNRETLMEKLKSMTGEERRQYMQNNSEKPQDPISQLVADGTITQEQANAIGEVIPRGGFGGGKGGARGFGGGFKGGQR